MRVRHVFHFGFRGHVVFEDLIDDTVHVETTAVIGDFNDDVAAFMEGAQNDNAGFRLAGFRPACRILEPVVGGIADHMGQRILDQLQNLTVQFGFRTVHLQVDLLAGFNSQIADDTRQFGPGIADRLHAGFHHPFLQFGGDVAETLQRHRKFAVVVTADHLQELVAGQHKFADQGHQVFKKLDVDADRLRCHGGFLRSLCILLLGGSRFLLGGSRRHLGLGGFFVSALFSSHLGGHLGIQFIRRRRRHTGCRRFFVFSHQFGGNRETAVTGNRAVVRSSLAAAGGFLVFGHQFGGNRETAFIGNRAVVGSGFNDGFDRRGRRRRCAAAAFGMGVQRTDNFAVVAFRFGAAFFQFAEQFLNGVDGPENQRHRLGGHFQLAVAEQTQQVFTGMGDLFKARQTQKSTGSFNGMHQSENVGKNRRITGVLFELDQLHIDFFNAFSGFRQKFVE